MYALQTRKLTKKYGNEVAVNEVSMNIRQGEIYGFIGQNGAGKTTLIKLVTGLISKSAGEYEIFGESSEGDLSEVRSQMGCLIEAPAFYLNMTARENLQVSRLVRNIVDKKCIDEVLDMVGLTEVQNKKVKKFSFGMKQRLAIANSLLGNPKFLILDEPINGLDPINIVKVREVLKKINKEKGTTILISSHILGELSEVASCYGIINKGILVEEITAEELHEKCRQHIEIQVKDTKKAAVIIEGEINSTNFEVMPQNIIKLYSNLDKISEINSVFLHHGVEISLVLKG